MESDDAEGTARALAVTSRTVAWWTLVGRLSGFVRVTAVAAVVGPTFFGNLFQTALLVPYTLSELLAGSLIPPLLAPRLVRLLAEGDRDGADRLAAGFLRIVVAILVLFAVIAAVTAPAIAWLVTLAVRDPQIRASQMALATPLLVTLLPQIIFDGGAAVAIAAQFARRRFAFPTAAPIIKNVGLVVTLVLGASIYGTGHEIEAVSVPEVVFLGIGATLAAALHALAQLWGARRAGFHLFRRGGGSDAAVATTIRTAIATSGTAGLSGIATLALVSAAGHVPGGAIAFQVGQYLLGLPVALGVRSIATVQLPQLAAPADSGGGFQQTYKAGLRLCLFMALPVALVFLALPQLLANVLSFGGMGSAGGAALITLVIVGLAPGVLAEAVFVLSMSASYAQLNAIAPLQAALARTIVCAVGIPLALMLADPKGALFCLALASSVGGAAAAAWLVLRDRTMRASLVALGPWLAVEASIAAAVVLPVMVIALSLLPQGSLQNQLMDAALLLTAGALFLAVQLARNSTELSMILGLRGRSPQRRWRHAE